MINGIECPKPEARNSSNVNNNVYISCGLLSARYYFDTSDDAEEVFRALIKPF